MLYRCFCPFQLLVISFCYGSIGVRVLRGQQMCSNEVGVGAIGDHRGSLFSRVSCRMKSRLMNNSGLTLASSCHHSSVSFGGREECPKRSDTMASCTAGRNSLALPKTQGTPCDPMPTAVGRASLEIPSNFDSECCGNGRNLLSNGMRHTQSMNVRAQFGGGSGAARHLKLEPSTSNPRCISRVSSYNGLIDANAAVATLSASKSIVSSNLEVSMELDQTSQAPLTGARNSAAADGAGGGNAHAPLRLRKHFSIVGGKPGMGESARNKRVLKMLLIVVALFGLLWLPNYVYITWLAITKLRNSLEPPGNETLLLQPSNASGAIGTPPTPANSSDGNSAADSDSIETSLWDTFRFCALWLGAVQAAINPWLYCLYSQRYRIAFTRLISCSGLRERFFSRDVAVRIGVVAGDESVSRFSYVRRSQSYNASRPLSRRNSGNRQSQPGVCLMSEGGCGAACGDGGRLVPSFSMSRQSRTSPFGAAVGGDTSGAVRTTNIDSVCNNISSKKQVALANTAQVHTDSDAQLEVPFATSESLNDQKPNFSILDLPAIDEERHNSQVLAIQISICSYQV